MSPFIWLVAAAILAAVEAVSASLITLWFVIGALAAFGVNLAGANDVVQLVVFFVVSVVCLVVLKPVFLKYRRRGESSEPTLVGSTAVVRERIDNDSMMGRVETPDHMSWAARSADGSCIEEGESVIVAGRESVKLIVERKIL